MSRPKKGEEHPREDLADKIKLMVAIGIPQEQIKRIFEPYYTTKKKGSGLGLMIVQRIVRDHDGRLELMSHGGKGTTFRIWLPKEERMPRLLGVNTEDE